MTLLVNKQLIIMDPSYRVIDPFGSLDVNLSILVLGDIDLLLSYQSCNFGHNLNSL